MFFSAAVQKTATAFKALSVLALCAALIIFSENCSKEALEGLGLCLRVLIPSLFPFMAVSSFIVKSGLSYQLGRPFRGIMKKVFGLNENFAPIILLSMIGGYPVGAKGIASLVESGAANKKEAAKAAMFAVCAGPGFIVNFVGMSIYQNKSAGLIILASQIISVLALGIVINLLDRGKNEINAKSELKRNFLPISSAIVESAAESSRGILSICAFVVLFSAFTGIFNSIISDGIMKNSLLCLLEVCSAVSELSKSCPVEFVAFAIGFGGLCVHFQIFSALGDIKVNKLSFFCIRIMQGMLTSLLTHLAIHLLPGDKMVFSTAVVEKAETFGGTAFSGAVLIIVAICFLYSLKSYKRR